MITFLLFVIALAIFMAGCSTYSATDAESSHVDSLNESAYRWHYRHIDSVRIKAQEALSQARQIHYITGEAEALSHLAFERFQQMDFDSTLALTKRIEDITHDPVERLVADVMQMRVAQRTSDNLAFFRHRNHALQRIEKLQGKKQTLNRHRRERLDFACGDFHIVGSTYFYYLDQQERAIYEIDQATQYCQLSTDTAQWLYYCYMRGSGGLSQQMNPKDVANEEFDYLLKCFWVARREGYLFFEANAAQSMATFFADAKRVATIRSRQPEVVAVLEQLFGQDNVAWKMAESALQGFTLYNDLYQRANALRTLGELAFDEGDFLQSVNYFDCALECVDWQQNKHKKTVPLWIASIRERLSMAYSALDMKNESDYNRNIYLDLLDLTREDAELGSRIEQLNVRSARQRMMLTILLSISLLTVIFVSLLVRAWRKHAAREEQILRLKFKRVHETAEIRKYQQAEEQELIIEQQAATEQRLIRYKRQNVEKRAKLQIVQGIVPLLDRIIHEVKRMKQQGAVDTASLHYVCELSDRIILYNSILTDWIQMEQGQLSLMLSSFALQPLFDSLRKSHFAYEQKGLTLDVHPTNLSVKADRALTLFMLNTLADNARKFTPAGGQIIIQATEGITDDGPYVELMVEDTGIGIPEDSIELILTHKVYDAGLIKTDGYHGEKGSGFGLMNCKGIIEKYRKTNDLFRVCTMGIDSTVGKGSRFWFRLPRVMMLVTIILIGSIESMAQQSANALADSVYYCNLHDRYSDALSYADSALREISRNHVTHNRNTHERLTLTDTGVEPIELVWWRRQDPMDYSLLLGLRNEVAIAALAMRNWSLYRYNNSIYTRLYKLTNQDPTLESFCEQTEHAQQRDRLVLMIIVALLLISVMAFYFLWARPRMRFRQMMKNLNEKQLQRLKKDKDAEGEKRQEDIEMAEDEHRRKLFEEERLHVQNQIIDNCLSTIKHETIYYPGRIQQLANRIIEKPTDETQSVDSLMDTLEETADYYKEVHMLLSGQALRQSEALNFRRRNIHVEEIIEGLPQQCLRLGKQAGVEVLIDIDNTLSTVSFRGDKDLVTMLFDVLIEGELALLNSQGRGDIKSLPLHLTVNNDSDFIRFRLENPFVMLSEDNIHELFMPHQDGIPFLIAKQIIREHDTFLGHPGCRIAVENMDEGHAIWFMLPVVVNEK